MGGSRELVARDRIEKAGDEPVLPQRLARRDTGISRRRTRRFRFATSFGVIPPVPKER
jgi:hypothetical protein